MIQQNKSLQRVLILCQDDMETIPYHRAFAVIDYLRTRVDWIDVLYYDRAFDKEGASVSEKLQEGLHNFFHKPRVRIKTDRNVTYYGIRRLPIDGIVSTWSQDPWIYHQFRKVNKMKYDLCISQAPGPGRIARWLRNKGIAKCFIYDDTDYFPGFAKGLRAHAISQQEKKGVRSADTVICVGEKLGELRTKQGAKHVQIVPNGVHINKYSLAQTKKAHPPTLIYVGSLAEWTRLDILLLQFKALLQEIKELRFLIIGDGPVRESLQSLIRQQQLSDSVLLLGQKKPEEVIPYMSESDIGILLPKPSILWEYACPIKLFEYASAGLPSLVTAVGETEKCVNEFNIGKAIPYDGELWKKEILYLFQHPEQYAIYRTNAIQLSAKFDWAVLMARYCSIIFNNNS